MMTNKKRIAAIFLAVLFTLIIVAGVPANSLSSETTTVKDTREVKTDKQVKQDKDVIQAKKGKNEQEAKPKFSMGKEVKEQNNPYADAQITTKIIPSAKNTFGYDILIESRPLIQLIHQPNIPGLPGNEGFTTKERAQKVADFVVQKIRRNEMPPIVTIKDLNNMGVLK